MGLALYCPVYGYYEKEKDTIGRRGDYYTSVSVGSLFGELLAFQFAHWLAECGAGVVQIVEAGAHDGRLAKDILTWMREYRPKLFERLEYWIVEPSAMRQKWQQRTLGEFVTQARFVTQLGALPNTPRLPQSSHQGGARRSRRFNPSLNASVENIPGPESIGTLKRREHRAPHSPRVRGIIFSNELLDAMPAHRFGWDATTRTWFVWGVTLKDERFVWTRMEEGSEVRRQTSEVRSLKPVRPVVEELPGELLDVLPDGFTIEVCPAREAWWREAAGVLEWGKLLTIDYGLEAEEFFAPERKAGTLRAYHRHQPSGDLLADPGEQDLTAHVNFSSLQTAGESMGLKTDCFLTQAQFLTTIAGNTWKGEASFGEWTRERKRQFQTYTHPEHLGRRFWVLVQSRSRKNPLDVA
jgi:SAM-dependent MidA family methyltransferase